MVREQVLIIHIYKSIAVMFQDISRFFFDLGFLSRTFTIHITVWEGEANLLSPLYHFHPLHRHLDISRAITTADTAEKNEIFH